MVGKKRERPQRLLVFELELWGTVVRVAVTNVDAARRMLTERHHFRGAWVTSPSVSVTIHGLDEGPGWRARVKKGGDVLSIVSTPRAETPPVPETALLGGEADDRPRDLERD